MTQIPATTAALGGSSAQPLLRESSQAVPTQGAPETARSPETPRPVDALAPSAPSRGLLSNRDDVDARARETARADRATAPEVPDFAAESRFQARAAAVAEDSGALLEQLPGREIRQPGSRDDTALERVKAQDAERGYADAIDIFNPAKEAGAELRA